MTGLHLMSLGGPFQLRISCYPVALCRGLWSVGAVWVVLQLFGGPSAPCLRRVKPHFRSSSSSEHVEGPPTLGAVPGGDLGRANSRNFVMERHSSPLTGHQDQGYSQKDSPTAQLEQNGDYSVGRGRRNVFRGRRRRDDDRVSRPQPSAETKTQTPKFDLLASNFPPLPGSTAKIPGEPVLESRMSDIVKGVCKEKEGKDSLPTCPAPAPEEQTPSAAPAPASSASSPSHSEPVLLRWAQHGALQGATP
ncbi:la-related protein 4-like [Neopelma chrysocephalum]|uniref:la-related protein 4-like n=1 Tax=Neopelma chrysocephalum TaxID=114329 RepID=UPI000FCD402C|nr:la-related protein 4-like [Neopelma chrysocephalum]